jgi:phosphoribosylformylglycinamidine synthase
VTDNLNFGNPTVPEVYFQMREAVEGLREACLALRTPVTGGNVSLYNQYRAPDGRVRAVLPTPTVGMVGVLPDVRRRATMGFQRDGDQVWLLGAGRPTLGASTYLATVHGLEAGAPPDLDLAAVDRLVTALAGVVQSATVATAHDVGDGGVAVALAEMAILGGRGVDATLPTDLGDRPDAALFGEAADLALVALPADRADDLARACAQAGVTARRIGVVGGDAVRVRVEGGAVAVPLTTARTAFEGTIERALS